MGRGEGEMGLFRREGAIERLFHGGMRCVKIRNCWKVNKRG